MGMTNQEEQALMDALYGTSYDSRWHYVISDKDFEEFELSQKGEVETDVEIDKQILWKKAGTMDHITRNDICVRLPKDNTGTQALREGL